MAPPRKDDPKDPLSCRWHTWRGPIEDVGESTPDAPTKPPTFSELTEYDEILKGLQCTRA